VTVPTGHRCHSVASCHTPHPLLHAPAPLQALFSKFHSQHGQPASQPALQLGWLLFILAKAQLLAPFPDLVASVEVLVGACACCPQCTRRTWLAPCWPLLTAYWAAPNGAVRG
jgi:hypothetical protein